MARLLSQTGAWLTACVLGAACSALAADAAPAEADAAQAAADLGALKADAPPATVHETWTRFCRASFGAEKEPMMYALGGRRLAEVAGGEWTHVSLSSACVAWETNLPATTWVAYGPTPACAKRTPQSERPVHVHVHYLTGLPTHEVTYFRRVSVDERGRRVASPLKAIAAHEVLGAVAVPGDLAGPPYVLDRPDTTYVLTADITAKGTALAVKVDGVTVDLNGHTVVYHDETVPKERFTDAWGSYVNQGAVGLRCFGHDGLTLLNGTVREGKGVNTGNRESTGFIPVYLRAAGRVRIAGVTVDYHSPQCTGMRIRGARADVDVHHCVFLDRGCIVKYPTGQGVRAFSLLGRTGPGCRLHHNLVKRTRQMGLVGADLLSHNEVYVDGWTRTGARALAAGPGGVVRRNRVFGTGLAVEALVAGTDGAVGHNFVHLEGIDTGKNRDPRKRRGAGDTMVGLRVDPGRAGPGRAELLCGDNTIVIGCRGGSEGRGLWLSSSGATAGLVCRDCTVKVRARDDKTDRIACVLADGPAGNDAPPPVRYRDCTLISNVCCVRLGGGRDGARGFEFDRCRLRRIGQDQRFHTLVAHGPARVAQTTLRDCRFGPGAAPDDVLWDKASPDSACRVVWTLTLRAPPGAEVAVKDSGHAAVFEGRVGPTGVIDVPLTGCVLGVKAGDEGPEPLRNARTPHAVTVSLDGKTTSRTVDMTGPRDITLTP